MRAMSLTALFIPLLFSAPLMAGEWPAGAKNQFISECQSSATAGTPPAKSKAYCSCAADRVSDEFSDEEIKQLQGQSALDATTRERLGRAASACLSHLNE
ncbi:MULTISPECIES: hypothetical protein [unclassified Pseudomonas]|uniref:hypothetical protein n=1 Tax=unclassified Pseudomonas TaxID=196821 RepID=UPI0019F62987|nr:hypothetical protein [Pseudomonas sp.]MBF0675078.1 hypothetical protein [Pseudomonas sp.]MBF0677040.1 hypothetical protein [Pseudomonas sp.]